MTTLIHYNFSISQSCAILYSGFLMSLIDLIQNVYEHTKTTEIYRRFIRITKIIISSRPMLIVNYKLLDLVRRLAARESILENLCSDSSMGNLKIDYDQGVMLYKNG